MKRKLFTCVLLSLFFVGLGCASQPLWRSQPNMQQASNEYYAVTISPIYSFDGYKGFLLQEYVVCRGRSLRIVIVGDELFSYWRLQQDGSEFLTNLKAGAVIDHESDPGLQEAGKVAVKDFCSETGLNLAGFDLLFPDNKKGAKPLFLEINYFFGRQGLGGSFRYYDLVDQAVALWLEGMGLSL